MNSPITIAATNFQAAWAEAVQRLSENKWDLWNLVVQIDNPEIVDNAIHKTMRSYCQENGLIGPDQVAYTIFPYKLFHPGISRQKLYNSYWRYFNGLHLSDYSTWRGTYFERMIRYKPVADNDEPTDQLGSIIDSIKNRRVNYGKSYVMLIPYPNRDGKRIMGAPCLNYITIQVEGAPQTGLSVSLLAVYRNHDFLKRAYGNYLGLCKLLQYIAYETGSNLGRVTCISSHAYIDSQKTSLNKLANEFMENNK